MNKADLVDAVAAELGETKAFATKAVDAMLIGLVRGVQEDDRVSIAGFGTFKKKIRKPRKGRNPQTGEEIQIPERTTIDFTPPPALKDELA